MNIVVVNEYRVEAELTGEELESLGVSFEKLDYADVETRRVIQTVLGEIRDAGVDFSLSGRVLIEAQRLPDGCRFCFSLLEDAAPGLRQLIKRPRLPCVLVCEDRTALRRGLRRLAPVAGTTVYARGDRFYIYVRADADETALCRAAEFGELRPADGALLPAFLEEYCVRMEPEN